MRALRAQQRVFGTGHGEGAFQDVHGGGAGLFRRARLSRRGGLQPVGLGLSPEDETVAPAEEGPGSAATVNPLPQPE